MKKYFYIALLIATLLASCVNFQGKNDKIFTATSPAQRTVAPDPTTIPTLAIDDGGLLSNEPCGPPCFLGIEPGKTSQAEASRILTQLGIIDICRNIDYFEKITNEMIGGWTCQSNFSITFRKSTGIVDFVRFEPPAAMTLQDIIAIHGNPDTVVILDTGLPEHPTTQASIYYSVLRIVLPLGAEQEETQYEIKPTTAIDVVGYLDPQSLQRDLKTFNEEIYPWKGYGIYRRGSNP